MVCPLDAIAMSLAGKDIGAAKYMACSRGLEFRHQIAPAIRRAPRAQETSQPKDSRVFLTVPNAAVLPVRDPLSAIHFSSTRRSRAVCQRPSGSFARHVFTT